MSNDDNLPKITFQHMKHPIDFLAFGLGSGMATKAPGTWGTLVGVLLYLPMQSLSLLSYLLIVLLSFAAGIYICQHATEKLGVHDHGGIVWDEFVGFWITMIAAPPGMLWVVVGFLLFRLFDIWKPWPIGWADKKVDGGFGIMLDDVLAGVWALLCVQLLNAVVSY